MRTLSEPAHPGHPEPPRPGEPWLPTDLAPIAAELVGSIRDYGPDQAAQVLERVPEHRHADLAVVLAAMVNPDASPAQLLAWTRRPPRSLDGTAWDPDGRGETWNSRLAACPNCGRFVQNRHMAQHRRSHATDEQQVA